MTTEIENNGKTGKVFLERDEIENETYKQIVHMVGHPTVEQARVMPDCHKSKNCCVGFTSHITDKVVPNFVGLDIGCGIISYPIHQDRKIYTWRDKKQKRLTEEIQQDVSCNPSGEEFRWSNALTRILDLANANLFQFTRNYIKHTRIDIRAKMKVFDENWVNAFLNKIKSNMGELERALGTLGGGNHFIEFDRSESTGEEYITVHSGSRIIGKKICEYHQRKIAQQNEVDWSYFDSEVEKFNKKNKNKQERKAFRDQLRSEIKTKDKKNYLDGDDALEYYRDLIWGQMFAVVNREVMLTKILEKLDLPFNPQLKIESVHNYIDFDDRIMRKGAISAHQGNECIIALNMTDGILLCEGKGNEDWNYSCAHGAGRQITRQKAQKNSQAIARRLAKELAKYEIMTVNPLTEIADEAPECYKDSEFIKLRIEDTVIIKEQLKPFINIKHTS